MKIRLAQFASCLLALVVLTSAPAAAQALNSGAQAVTLNASLSESLSVNISANTVSFTLTAGSTTNAGSNGVTATTTWNLRNARTSIFLYAYFNSTGAALADGFGNTIPSADLQ